MTIIRSLLLLSLVLGSASASAGKYDFLKKSALTEFSAEDADSFRKLARETLDHARDGDIVPWRGESGLEGRIKVQLSYDSEGVPCRRIRLAFKNSFDKKEFYKFDLCKPDEAWEFMDTPVQNFTKAEEQKLVAELDAVLEEGAINHPVSWTYPRRQSGGTFVPLKNFERNQLMCRELAVSIFDGKGRTSDGVYAFCKDKDGQWQRYFGE